MSDYRTAEAARSLVLNAASSLPPARKEIETLRADRIGKSTRLRGDCGEDPSEAELYDRFAKEWAAYQIVAARVIALARAGPGFGCRDFVQRGTRRRGVRSV